MIIIYIFPQIIQKIQNLSGRKYPKIRIILASHYYIYNVCIYVINTQVTEVQVILYHVLDMTTMHVMIFLNLMDESLQIIVLYI